MIKIPYRLEDRLKTSRTEYNKVSNLFSSISELMSAHTDFFPEYTNHGIPHVQTVLNLADQLISDETLNRLRPEDICFLICAVTIHDLGMFLSVDGVQVLMHGDWKNKKARNLDKLSWAEAWEDFKSEVRRFSDEKMLSTFGELIDVNIIQTEIQKMQRSDFLIIGEFLRRFHPRLAHDIAIYGFPGSEDISVLPKEFSPPHRKLIGLLARSHGMSLRKTESYVKELGNAKKPCNCPAFYLMAVLRIADLLDAGKHRAPEILQKRQAVFIPVSQQEWTWNQQVDMNNYTWDQDAGTLTIVGEPESSTQFVRLKDWLEYIQQELDLCWAVISEKYGAEYSLSIHRVESPILDPENKTYRDQFLAKEAKLQANPALLKHLVGPLYGDEPTYGVRELLQNAVDACVERENIEKNVDKKHGDPNYKGHVTVNVDTNAGTFTIEDNGIGMNEDVLLNYYLSAGSSYRYSDSWAKDHAPEGKSQVTRTGKFGVGFLAAFLLGEKVKVTTRHRDDDMGYEFEFDIRSKPLDIRRIQKDKPGTMISIDLSAKALAKFTETNSSIDWVRWYVFDDPDVQFFLNGEEKTHTTLPRDPDECPDWFSLKSDLFPVYLWKYDQKSHFYCNGIEIPDSPYRPFESFGFDIGLPSILLIDKNALLDLDLARKKLISVPDAALLAEEIYKYTLARLLLVKWDTCDDVCFNLSAGFWLHGSYGVKQIPFLLKQKEFTLHDEHFLFLTSAYRCVNLYYCGHKPYPNINEIYSFLPSDFPCIVFSSWEGYLEGEGAFSSWLPNDFGMEPEEFWQIHDFDYPSYLEPRFNLPASIGNTYWISENAVVDNMKYIENSMYAVSSIEEDGVHKWIRSGHDIPIDISEFSPEDFPIAVYMILYPKKIDEDSVFLNLLRKYLGEDIWIPYDMEERKKKFPKAFEELKPYIDHIETYDME